MNKKISINGQMIFFEGPDGSGKSTQLKLVAKELERAGYNVIQLRQPGMPGEHGDNVRKALFGEDRYREFWSARMLFIAEHIEFMSRYGYNKDSVILCDRYVPISNTCIGGADYGTVDDVLEICSPLYNLSFRKPDCIIVCSVTPETVDLRLKERAKNSGEINHYDMRESWWHSKVCDNYDLMESIEEQNPKRLGLSRYRKVIHNVDANKDVVTVREDIMDILKSIYTI